VNLRGFLRHCAFQPALIWGVIAALAALALGIHCQRGFRDIDREVAALEKQKRALVVIGGDVALRDVPKAHEILHGHFFTDPYYLGEAHWYPFVMPAAAALVARISGRDVPEAYFRLEVIATAFSMLIAGCAIVVFGGLRSLPLVPLAILLGWLEPGHGLYPADGVRGAFCLFLVLAGLVWEGRSSRARSPTAYLTVGVLIGTLGIWQGASFMTATGIGLLLLLPLARDCVRPEQRFTALKRFALFLVGAAGPLLLLFGPQLLKYGQLVYPQAAAAWLEPLYEGHGIADAFKLALLPRDAGLVLVAAFVIRALWIGGNGTTWRRSQPLLAAFAISLILAHGGFVVADLAHPGLARIARRLLPAPPHTFWLVTTALLPIVKLLGLVALLETLSRIVKWLLRRFLDRHRTTIGTWAKWGPMGLALALFVVLPFHFPKLPPRTSDSQDRGFYNFTKQVAATVGRTPVFFRYPGMFVQGGAFKVPLLSLDYYASQYVQASRRRAVEDLDRAVASGNIAGADAYFVKNGYQFIMEDPRAKSDPVILRCGGSPIMSHSGFVLRRYEGCRL
jgi:hypothetical protein